ncbi:Protein farnesyltransferase subunit beta [Choanephora cucurbitarum]|uniref:Protein farnesyltransferase subunit beta n=1 Tax=Choanephora cucurbitarum TaxID=101091 RepID=A0A1C7N1W1_9FUNG|nr:Protein farnesyltransferase subunit beta [Choanephora cucurbitarum]
MGILNGDIPLNNLRFKDDKLPTDTSIDQKRTEDSVLEKFVPYAPNNIRKRSVDSIELNRKKHIAYLLKGLQGLGRWAAVLDASKPWLMYWILHSLDLLDYTLDDTMKQRAIQTLKRWQLPSGGFGGGGDQLAHLATTYAAVNSLAILGTQEAYDVIDRTSLYTFLMRMKQPDGSFTMHEGGEIDIRGSYCALSTAALTQLLTPELEENCIVFIKEAQTYEGGIGPYPGKEAHNGYTFCGLAAMEIVGGMDELDMDTLLAWCSGRQMSLEGGFQGRTNKLVDGCYSFWGAGDFPIIKAELERSNQGDHDYMFDREALQEYILLCCQSDYGGLIDKPGKGADYYHTCYCLSGLSSSQHTIEYVPVPHIRGGLRSLLWTCRNDFTVVGDIENTLAPTHPVHNITLRAARNMIRYFYGDILTKEIELDLPVDDEPVDE